MKARALLPLLVLTAMSLSACAKEIGDGGSCFQSSECYSGSVCVDAGEYGKFCMKKCEAGEARCEDGEACVEASELVPGSGGMGGSGGDGGSSGTGGTAGVGGSGGSGGTAGVGGTSGASGAGGMGGTAGVGGSGGAAGNGGQGTADPMRSTSRAGGPPSWTHWYRLKRSPLSMCLVPFGLWAEKWNWSLMCSHSRPSGSR